MWFIAPGAALLYTGNFGHYNVYASITAVIILPIWLWISNSAVLLGAEFNADLQWGRAIAPESSRPGTIRGFRDTRKLRKKTEANVTPDRA